LVAEKLTRGNDWTWELILAGLLHDAAEAYVADVPSSLKALLNHAGRGGHTYQSVHDSIQAAIYAKFGISPYLHNPIITGIDRAILVFEAEALFGLSEEELHRLGFPTEYRHSWMPWEPDKYEEEVSDRHNNHPLMVRCRFLDLFGKATRNLAEKERKL
jgi:hypothetical protein